MAGTTNNDPFEEFQFRPINEGLGFHRKNKKDTNNSTLKVAAGIATTNSAKTNATATTLNSHTSSIKTDSPFQSPLPRTNDALNPSKKIQPQIQVPVIEDNSISQAQTAVNEILKSLNQKRQLDFSEETEKQKMQAKPSKPQPFAAVLDGMLILAAFLMSLILMLTITKVDLVYNLTNTESSVWIYIATASLFATVTFIYMVVNRAFLGYTPGEWAFDQICGTISDRKNLMYIPRTIFRTALVILTGFIVLPVLSYLFNKDIAGKISGVMLYKKANS